MGIEELNMKMIKSLWIDNDSCRLAFEYKGTNTTTIKHLKGTMFIPLSNLDRHRLLNEFSKLRIK